MIVENQAVLMLRDKPLLEAKSAEAHGKDGDIAIAFDGPAQNMTAPTVVDECGQSEPSSSAYTWDWLRKSSERYGNLSRMECVCGCAQQEQAANHTRIECGIHPRRGFARACRFERLFFYSDESARFSSQRDRVKGRPRPLFLAICSLPHNGKDFTQPGFW